MHVFVSFLLSCLWILQGVEMLAWRAPCYGGEDEDWDEEGGGRSFLYREVVLSGFYSPAGVAGLPPGDRTEDHFELSPRPPGNYTGLDYVRTATPASAINRRLLPGWLPLDAVDLHPRLLLDRTEESGDIEQVKFAPQDFWVRFNPARADRLTLRLGQFVIPYGVNPILAPRQQFILPLEALDLGLKWDWGLVLKGPAGAYDWELAASTGSGEGLHSPHLLSAKRRSYLASGRIGAPTYWDFQYGLSFLYGELPPIRGARVFGPAAISRWRLGFDALYKYGTYLLAGAQATYGQDGFAGDEEFVEISAGERVQVLGYRVWVDWVVPRHLDMRFSAQFESLLRDLSAGADDTAAILEATYSFTTAITLTLDYRAEVRRAAGKGKDALFLTFVYYAL